jgi:transposase-like protein
VEGASVARVARAHDINANQVFGWRRLYRAGRLGERKPAMKLLPVRVSESVPAPLPVERGSADFPKAQPGTIHIELRQAQVRIEGNADAALGARVAGVPAGMIGPPTNTRVWIAAGVTDLRRGFTGLSALVQSKLEQSPFSGTSLCFADGVAI